MQFLSLLRCKHDRHESPSNSLFLFRVSGCLVDQFSAFVYVIIGSEDCYLDNDPVPVPYGLPIKQ